MSSKIALTRIREAYRYMGNEELLAFSKEEGLKLSTAAFLVLKEELQNRRIGTEVLLQLEHDIILQYSLNQKKFEEDLHKDLFISSMEFALAAKYKGMRQYAIYTGLVERGVSMEYANYMINKLDDWAIRLRREAIIALVYGAGIFVAGLALTYFTFKTEKFEPSGFLVMLAGSCWMLLSWKRKNKYQKILYNTSLDNIM